MIEEHHITFEKSARYFTSGTLNKNTKSVWLVFHGYGQLAKEFINDFETLENDSTFIVAPEATNKFYLRGFTGQIGTTWMTKEDRENEINDYVEMINKVFNKIIHDFVSPNIKINILAFSQGTNTSVRWLDKHKPKIDNLILWSGSFPHDCNYQANNNYWSNINIKIVMGDKDRFLTKEILETEKNYFKSQNLNYNFYNFNGDHVIDKKMLNKLSNEL